MDEVNFLNQQKVIICAGSGGVGKTTVSASLGVKAAESGLTVLVMTIDPAKRLSTSLGLSQTKGVVKVLVPDAKGSLFAEILDSKKIFEDFLSQNIPNKNLLKKITGNRLYQQLSTTLSGSQEFTSIVALNQAVRSNKYDLVILDTPPSEHAIDFLRAPQKIEGLFNGKVTKWFIEGEGQTSWFGKILHKGTRVGLGILQKITGSEFMNELSDFFMSIKSIEKSIQSSTNYVRETLAHPKTSFILVTSFDDVKVKEGVVFYKELQKFQYQLRKIVVNRAYPMWLDEVEIEKVSSDLFQEIYNYYIEKRKGYNQIQEDFANQIEVVQLPEMSQDIYGIDSLKRFSHYINFQMESPNV